MNVLRNPFVSQTHTMLAQALWEKRMIPRARQELVLADALQPSVLGASTTRDLLNQWDREPERLRRQYQFWQNIVTERPDYRDAYMMLASLAYELSRTSDARMYIRKALRLDPNFRTAQDFSLAMTQ